MSRWSPGLIPKPTDWGPEIDIAGFVFLDLASSFEPSEDLSRFLEAGEPPVYIGFGSSKSLNPLPCLFNTRRILNYPFVRQEVALNSDLNNENGDFTK